MKIAIILSGNLRTFLSPTRENSKFRLCDNFIRNIVKPNNADVFVFTDTNDFYYNDIQYFATDKRIELLNDNAYRLHNKIDFIDNSSAKIIISEQLKILGENLKSIIIEDAFNAEKDPKFQLLNDANVGGSSPTLLIHQFRKLKLAYEMVKKYEIDNHIKYDLIVKWRFDIASGTPLNLKSYDYINNDIYVAGVYPPIIYDWHAFGTRRAMDLCLSLYDVLGSYLREGQVYLCDKCRYYSGTKICLCDNNNLVFEITLAPEYHLFRTLKDNNIRFLSSEYSASPYRYKEENTKITVENIINNLNIDATVSSYTSSPKINTQTYTKR